MEIPLGSARRRAALLAVSLAAAVIISFQAARLWLASHWIESEKREHMERGAALEPGNGDAWDRLGHLLQWDFADPDLPRAIEDYKKAVAADPLSAHYWIDLATAYEASGDDARAQQAYARARAVYPQSAEVAFHYGNFLLREQKYSEANGELQQAVRADPTLLPLAISRTWRATEDVQPLLDQMLPADQDAYLQAIDFFASIHKLDPALAVWQRLLALRKPFALPRTFSFFDELIREDRSDDARRVWRDAVAAAGLPHDAPASQSVMWNGNFAREPLNGGLDWRWGSVPGVSIEIDSSPAPSGSRSLRLDFNGGRNVSLEVPAQYVPVEPGRSYHFHASMRTAQITTESGMRFSITDPNHSNAVNLLTENFTGSRVWAPVDADLTTGPDTHFLLVQVVRRPSRLFDNKLGGSAWIADVSLVPLNADAGPPSR
jgi:tetratricopeptide (TPR) repeat protein